MKWLAAAAGVVAAGAVSFAFLGGRDEPVVPQALPVAPATAPAARASVPAPARRIEPPAGVSLHGVVLRGAQSQALLTVDGQQQSYGVGAAVKAGWTIQAIHEQQVVLANGSATTALGVASPTPAAAAPGVPTTVAATASARLPGFVAGAPAPLSDAGASERNRRFLDAVRKARAHQ